MIGSGPEYTFVVAAAGGLLIAVLLVLAGTQLFANAHAANVHLANAAPLPSTVDRRAANAVADRALGAAAPLDAPSARIADGWLPDGDAHAHTIERLNEYYAANINQGAAIFWASLMSMIVGFAIIFIGIVTAGAHPTTAIVAGVAGVLSQFIAATFLVALRSTQQQSTTYAQTLVELHLRDVRATAEAQAITLGLHLLDTISGDGANALANQTRAALAMGLILKQTVPPVISEPIPTVVNAIDNADRGDLGAGSPPRARSVTFDSSRDPDAQPARAADR